MKIKNYKIIFGFVLYLFSGSSFALDCDRALTELTERLSSFKDGEKIEENIIEVPQGFVIRRKYQLSNGLIIEIMSPEQFIISPHRCTDCRDLRHYKALQDSIQELSVFLKTQYSRRENNFWTKDFTKKATDPKKLIERLTHTTQVIVRDNENKIIGSGAMVYEARLWLESETLYQTPWDEAHKIQPIKGHITWTSQDILEPLLKDHLNGIDGAEENQGHPLTSLPINNFFEFDYATDSEDRLPLG